MRSARLTFTSAAVALGILVVVVAFLLPVVRRSRESSWRAQCIDHLRRIGQGLQAYSNTNRGLYPRTRWQHGDVVTPVWGTRARARDPFAEDGPGPNDVSAAMFLLVRQGYVTADMFLCPARGGNVDGFAGGSASARSNFTDAKQNLGYSYSNPYFSDRAHSAASGFRLILPMDSVVAGDLNPGIAGTGDDVRAVRFDSPAEEIKKGNSNNHRKDGQNLLFYDGHVEFCTTPFAGSMQGGHRDNVYTASDGEGGNSSAFLESSWGVTNDGYQDSFLLPTDD